MFSKFKVCGYLNLWVFKICGYSNLWVHKICGYSNLWVHKICDDTKFQVSGREYQNISAYRVNRKTYVLFSIYAFCHMCKAFHVN